MDRLQEAQRFRDNLFQRLPKLESDGECRVPNIRFWDHYKANKHLYHDACIGVRELEDGWWIIAYDFVDRKAEAEREIREMLSRHRAVCSGCYQTCEIERSVMKNGYPRYNFYCRRCSCRMSGALPHKLVNHLLAQGQEVFDRE